MLVHAVSPVRHRQTLEPLVNGLDEAYRGPHLPEPGWLAEVRGGRSAPAPHDSVGNRQEPASSALHDPETGVTALRS